MIKSMTAYGRATSSTDLGKWVVEIHSVNKKHLDYHISLPRDFLQFDLEIRKLLSEEIYRGQVTVRVSFRSQADSSIGSQSQMSLLKSEMEKMASSLELPLSQITFPLLYEESKGVPLDLEGKEGVILQELQSVAKEALKAFISMRKIEGSALASAFEEHLSGMKNLLQEIEKESGTAEEKYRKKILEKLADFKEVLSEDKERVLKEVFFYADKLDITEETIRLASHINQFESLIASTENSVGRAMEFLVQEMGRETNTISSKSEGLEILKSALKMKAELEKIKEQVLNVE